MFTLLLSIALCGKFALSSSYLQQFNKVAETTIEDARSGYLYRVLQQPRPIYTKDICDAYDEETVGSNIPKQVCAEECLTAPYFCTSFLLAFQYHELKCFHYAIKAASIRLEKHAAAIELLDRFVWIKNEPDFVTTVAELSNKFINGPLRYNDWKDIVNIYYTNPDWADYYNVDNFGSYCEEAIRNLRNIDSISKEQTLRLGSLDRKSFITTLKKFHSTNPEYSPDFDKIVLIFLKWFGPENCNFSDSHYLAVARETQNRVFVHSFSSGHYVTITQGTDGYDHITYISADGSFGQTDSDINAAISTYLQSTDSLRGLAEGTTELFLDPGVEYEDYFDLSNLGSTKAEVMQRTAITMVWHLVAALNNDLVVENPFNTTLLCNLITFVLSWAYKIRQSDFNMAGEAEILNLVSKMKKTLLTGFSPDSMLDVITQH